MDECVSRQGTINSNEESMEKSEQIMELNRRQSDPAFGIVVSIQWWKLNIPICLCALIQTILCQKVGRWIYKTQNVQQSKTNTCWTKYLYHQSEQQDTAKSNPSGNPSARRWSTMEDNLSFTKNHPTKTTNCSYFRRLSPTTWCMGGWYIATFRTLCRSLCGMSGTTSRVRSRKRWFWEAWNRQRLIWMVY